MIHFARLRSLWEGGSTFADVICMRLLRAAAAVATPVVTQKTRLRPTPLLFGPTVRLRVDDVHKVHHYHHTLNTVAIDKQARAEETEYYRVALDKTGAYVFPFSKTAR